MSTNSNELVEQLNTLLREPVRRPEDARRAARAAQALENLLRAAHEAEDVLASEQRLASGVEGSLSGKTLHDAAEIVLEEAGEPLHAKELGRRIYARGWTHPRGAPSRPDQIVNQLAARLRAHSHRFRPVGPNTFALVKWDNPNRPMNTRRPRLTLFSGHGEIAAKEIGERPDAPAGGGEWRSS